MSISELNNQQLLATASKYSKFVAREVARFPELEALNFAQSYAAGDLLNACYQAVSKATNSAELNELLRKWRREQLIRIAVRDLNQLADLEEVLRDTSELAEALVIAAVDFWYQQLVARYGVPIGKDSGLPQRLISLAMGKLGGYELNFSSDIDLIFLYPEAGETENPDGKSLSNEQFFSRLVQNVNKSLTELTPTGFVYRVDLRLRPFGETGPLAISFTGAEHYYTVHGRAWERYALVKARVLGLFELENLQLQNSAKELMSILKPFVYRRYIDYTAIDSLRDLKQMIRAQVRQKSMQDNIKLGAGGIREIEFIAQAFQLVHGGRDLGLQTNQLLPTLQYLGAENYLPLQDVQQLLEIYRFLRVVENRLQQWDDQQIHELPVQAENQQLLAKSLGFATFDSFSQQLEADRQAVQLYFDQIFAEETDVCDLTESLHQAWVGPLEDEALLVLTQFGFAKPAEVLNLLRQFKKSRTFKLMSAEASQRLDQVMAFILKAIADMEDQQAIALARVLQVIENILRRSVYLVLLKENPLALQHFIKLCAISPWLAETLAKYPALMDQLLDLHNLYKPLELQALLAEAQNLLQTFGQDEEEFMQQLRHWRHAQVFKVAAADITGQVPVMKVSDYLTWIAQAVLQATHDFVWQLQTSKLGFPSGKASSNFAILGYGKLGGLELGYGSDLDLVFLYADNPQGYTEQQPAGKNPVENSVFYTRMAQKISSVLTTLMPAGILYEVDTRLRPNGNSGLIVTPLASFEEYQTNQAWVWEHQALIRARCVVGSEQVCAEFEQFRQDFLAQPRDAKLIKQEVLSMREKMRASLDQSTAKEFDIKHGMGGIVDIEFIVQYLVLAFGNQQPGLVIWPDNMRILDQVADTNLLTKQQVKTLQNHYRSFRSSYHRLSLQNQQAIVPATEFSQQKAEIIAIWQQLMLD